MTRRRYLAVALSALACVGATTLSVAAAASPKEYATTISFQIKSVTAGGVTRPTVEGTLSSPKAACVKDRFVWGDYFTASAPHRPVNLGGTDSNSNGHFALPTRAAPGSVRRVQLEADYETLGTGTFCETGLKTKTF